MKWFAQTLVSAKTLIIIDTSRWLKRKRSIRHEELMHIPQEFLVHDTLSHQWTSWSRYPDKSKALAVVGVDPCDLGQRYNKCHFLRYKLVCPWMKSEQSWCQYRFHQRHTQHLDVQVGSWCRNLWRHFCSSYILFPLLYHWVGQWMNPQTLS